MSWLKWLTTVLGGAPAGGQPGGYHFAVQCSRCGEVIPARVDLANELSAEYGEADGASSLVCRKVLMGKGRCFQQIEITLTFDAGRRLIDRQIAGGDFVE